MKQKNPRASKKIHFQGSSFSVAYLLIANKRSPGYGPFFFTPGPTSLSLPSSLLFPFSTCKYCLKIVPSGPEMVPKIGEFRACFKCSRVFEKVKGSQALSWSWDIFQWASFNTDVGNKLFRASSIKLNFNLKLLTAQTTTRCLVSCSLKFGNSCCGHPKWGDMRLTTGYHWLYQH